jgi:hypothetical protein
MPSRFQGGCFCGAIRYECSSEPLFMINCHCRDCQRMSGSAYAAILSMPKGAFALVKGKPEVYTATADAGSTVSRWFCSQCGAPVYHTLSALPDLVGVKVGSLDDPSWYRPTMDIYTGSAQPWDLMNPELKKFPGMPAGIRKD